MTTPDGSLMIGAFTYSLPPTPEEPPSITILPLPRIEVPLIVLIFVPLTSTGCLPSKDNSSSESFISVLLIAICNAVLVA